VTEFVSYLLEVEIVRFLGAGGIATIIYFAIFLFLVELMGVRYDHASLVAFVPWFVVNFLLQKYWAFRSPAPDEAGLQLALFSLKNLLLFMVNYALLKALVERLDMRPRYAQVLLTIGLTAFSFFASQWIFKT
jgi:putative flippase GtrA